MTDSASKWDQFVEWGKAFEREDFAEQMERPYKLQIAQRILEAKTAFIDGTENWQLLLKRSFSNPNNITGWQQHASFLDWIEKNPDDAQIALSAIWDDDPDVRTRFDRFEASVPGTSKISSTNLASFLNMANGVTNFPPYKPTRVMDAYHLAGFPTHEGKSFAEQYTTFLMFLDEFIHQAAQRNIEIKDRLDAQGLMWAIAHLDPPDSWPEADKLAFQQYRGESPDPGVSVSEVENPEITTSEEPEDSRWDELIHWAKILHASGLDYGPHRTGAESAAAALSTVHSALIQLNEDWPSVLQSALSTPYLREFTYIDDFTAWASANSDRASEALLRLWDENVSVNDRIDSFRSIAFKAKHLVNIRIASTLNVRNGAIEFPLYHPGFITRALTSVGFSELADATNQPTTSEGMRYRNYLDFIDQFIEQAARRNLAIDNRLDAILLIKDLFRTTIHPGIPWGMRREFRLFRSKPIVPDPWPPDHTFPPFADIIKQFQSIGFRITDRTLRQYHIALKTRGFVILAGPSGTGKTWLASAYANAVGGTVSVVPVAPNWTANEDLMGYFNPVSQLFHDTEFTRFVREAADAFAEQGAQARPYYLVLDEMNLARVEYYFASFLSAMEERSRSEDRTSNMSIGGDELLTLTPNLFVIGTVNIDETTHGFADKVYDRAQLLVLNVTEEEIARHLGDSVLASDLLAIWQIVSHYKPFAFRVLDEIHAYVKEADALEVRWEAALDEQILHKILPKLNGHEAIVGIVLSQLANYLHRDFPLSHARAATMSADFSNHGIASYFG